MTRPLNLQLGQPMCDACAVALCEGAQQERPRHSRAGQVFCAQPLPVGSSQ